MARGELSFSAVRALTRVADPENEADLLDLARGCTTQQLERIVRGWRRGSREDEAALERERHESRTFSVFPDDDGMYAVRGRLDPEVGALFMRAIEAASDALFRERPVPAAMQSEAARAKAARQLRADAIALVAERAMAVGFGGAGQVHGEARPGHDDRTGHDDRSDPKEHMCRNAPLSGTRAERYQVLLHADADTLTQNGEPGRSELEDGTRVSAELGIPLTLLAPICSGEQRGESSGWRGGLSPDVGGVR